MLWRKPYATREVRNLELDLDGVDVTVIVDELDALPEALLWGRLLDGVDRDWSLLVAEPSQPLETLLAPSILAQTSTGPRPAALPGLDGRAAAYAHSGRLLLIGPPTEEALDAIVAASARP